MSTQAYRVLFPDAELCDASLVLEDRTGSQTQREGSRATKGQLRIGSIPLRQYEAPIGRCANKPAHYEYPPEAKLAALCLARCQRGFPRNMYVWGPAGTGKSALGKALAHDLQYEYSCYNLRDGVDVEQLLGSVVVENRATESRLGSLTLDLQGRDDGKGGRRPVFILLDDVDRAPAAIAEVLRAILDSETRSIHVAACQCWVDVHPETVIWGTGNSNGQGDHTGMYASVEVQDAALLDRYHRVLKMNFMDAAFETRLLRAKFPLADEFEANFIANLVSLAGEIRSAIENRELFMNFGHRPLENAVELYEDLCLAERDTAARQKRDPRYGPLREEAVRGTVLGWLSGTNLTTVARLALGYFPMESASR